MFFFPGLASFLWLTMDPRFDTVHILERHVIMPKYYQTISVEGFHALNHDKIQQSLHLLSFLVVFCWRHLKYTGNEHKWTMGPNRYSHDKQLIPTLKWWFPRVMFPHGTIVGDVRAKMMEVLDLPRSARGGPLQGSVFYHPVIDGNGETNF
jgi:hypothetical protein